MLGTLLRGTSRIIIVLLIAYNLILRVVNYNQPQARSLYFHPYQQIRAMLYIFRIVQLPDPLQVSDQLSTAFNYVLLLDMLWLAMSGLLTLLGRRLGGWMLAWWYVIFLLLVYTPILLQAPKQPFTIYDSLQMFRKLALLGTAIALTVSPQRDKKQETAHQLPIK